MIAPGVVAAAAADAPPAISADILEVLMESGYGVYVIKISSVADGYNAYTLKRRYRQFDQMHAQLKTNYRGLPDLPVPTRDEQVKAESRRDGLTTYLRALLADPVLARSDEVCYFLELSSAFDLFAKLHQKDVNHHLLIAAKDEELEKMRANLSAASSERATARAECVSLREAMVEGEAVRASLSGRLKAMEEATLALEGKANAAQRELEQLRETCAAAEQEAASIAKDAAERAAALENRANAAEETARACEAKATEERAAHLAAADEWAAAKASLEQEAALLRSKAMDADEQVKALRTRLVESEATRAADAAAASSSAATAAAEKSEFQAAAAQRENRLEERANVAEAEVCQLREALAASEAAGAAAASSLLTSTEIEAKYAAVVVEANKLRLSLTAARGDASAAAERADAAHAEVLTMQDELESARAAASEARASAASSEARALAAEGQVLQGQTTDDHPANAGLRGADDAMQMKAELEKSEAQVATLRETLAAERDEASKLKAEFAKQLRNAERDRATAIEELNSARGALATPVSGNLGDALPSPSQALNSLALTIPAFRRGSGQDSGSYWAYQIFVTCAGVSYSVFKRFSDFKATHKRLIASGISARVAIFPSLPPQRVTATQNESFAERRRGELEQYLSLLVREPEMRSCGELHAFLELGLILRRTTTIGEPWTR